MVVLDQRPETAPEVVPAGWDHDHCQICWWDLFESPDEAHSIGYTDSRGWLCSECYDQFVATNNETKSR